MKRFLLFLALGNLGLSVFPGCASLGKTQDSSPLILSKHAVLLEVPFAAQESPNLCGSACVEMLTRYYAKRLPEEDGALLRKEAKDNNGASGNELKKALKDAGYFTAVFPGTLDRGQASLYNFLDQKQPVIVMLGSGPRHYEVVAGYDPDQSLLVLMDPARGQVAVPIQNFAKGWGKANDFTLLASPESSTQDP